MKKQSAPTNFTLSSPWLFFVLVLGWSWLFWIPTALLGLNVKTPIIIIGWALGGLGPMLGGVVFTYLTQEKEGRRDYWLRIIDLTRIKVQWYLFVFLTIPVLITLAALLDILSGGYGGTLDKAVEGFLFQPLTIIPFALYIFFGGPFVEELGWRGYILDRLQSRWNALVSSLILGVVWALWHLPLFFIKDTYQYNLGFGSVSFLLFMIQIIAEAVLLSWIFNNTRRSTLAAILFHFMINFTGELIAATNRTDIYYSLLWVISAIVVALLMIRNSKASEAAQHAASADFAKAPSENAG
jgi:membrane protease YdiL (CAAX protease family)